MLKKKLDIDRLEVESFDTSGTGEPLRGTVRAHEDTEILCDTWQHSCGWSEIECPTQGCRTDWETCGNFGSCCPAICW